jgi:hypothetical protein
MNVLDVDDVPVLVVAGVEMRLAGILVGNGACSQAASCDVMLPTSAPGPQFQIDPAVLAAPAGEDVGLVDIVATEIDG